MSYSWMIGMRLKGKRLLKRGFVALALSLAAVLAYGLFLKPETSASREVESDYSDQLPVSPVVSDAKSHSMESQKELPVEFDETPLRDVIEIFNRTGQIEIEIADPELETLKVSGAIDKTKPETLLHLLELIFEIEVERLGENHVALKSSSKAL